MVVLPSDCGEWKLSICGHEREMARTVPADDMFVSVSCFWLNGKDVALQHQNGCCAAIVYDVLWDDHRPQPSIEAGSARVRGLESYLKEWLIKTRKGSKAKSERYLSYKLSRRYPAFSMMALSPKDRSSLRLAERACYGTDFHLWFLSTQRKVESRVSIRYTHYGKEAAPWNSPEEESQSATITSLTTHALVPYGHSYVLQDLDFLGEDWFKSPDHESVDEDDRFIRQVWVDSAIVLVPRENVMDFFLQNVVDEKTQIKAIQDSFKAWQNGSNAENDELYSTWQKACNASLETWEGDQAKAHSDWIRTVLDTSLMATPMDWSDISSKALDLWSPNVARLSAKDYHIFAKTTARLGWQVVSQRLATLFQYTGDLYGFHSMHNKFVHEHNKHLGEELKIMEAQSHDQSDSHASNAVIIEWDPTDIVVQAAQHIAYGEDVQVIRRDQEHICSLKWNGSKDDDVVWVANERFAWC